MIVPNNGTINESSQGAGSARAIDRDYLRHMFGTGWSPWGGEIADEGALGPFEGTTSKLSDADIRAALDTRAGRSATRELHLLEEVRCWRGYVRADYMCFYQDTISIIEIKSDRDSLRRFQEQARVYSAVADRVALVVGWSLASHALRAAPCWWDVILAERDSEGGVRFAPLRDGTQNRHVTPGALVAMLPLDEVRRLARKAEERRPRSSVRELRQFVASSLSCTELRASVFDWLARLVSGRRDRA